MVCAIRSSVTTVTEPCGEKGQAKLVFAAVCIVHICRCFCMLMVDLLWRRNISHRFLSWTSASPLRNSVWCWLPQTVLYGSYPRLTFHEIIVDDNYRYSVLSGWINEWMDKCYVCVTFSYWCINNIETAQLEQELLFLELKLLEKKHRHKFNKIKSNKNTSILHSTLRLYASTAFIRMICAKMDQMQTPTTTLLFIFYCKKKQKETHMTLVHFS